MKEGGRWRVTESDEDGMPAKEPPGQRLCTSLEQDSPFLLVQYLVTGRIPPSEPQDTCIF